MERENIRHCQHSGTIGISNGNVELPAITLDMLWVS